MGLARRAGWGLYELTGKGRELLDGLRGELAVARLISGLEQLRRLGRVPEQLREELERAARMVEEEFERIETAYTA